MADANSTDVKDEASANAQAQAGGKTGMGHSSAKDAVEPVRKTVKPSKRRPIVMVAVILCSLIMVGSFLLPSLSAIVSGIQKSLPASTEAATTAAATTDAAADEATNEQLDKVDSKYSGTVEALEAKLESNAEDAATLINVANTCYTWASSATEYAETDDEKSHVTDLYEKAKGYYERYLAISDAGSARASHAMCLYYLGDTDSALAELLEVTEADEGCTPAWADLGTIYQDQGRADEATAALNHALDSDPDNKYGLKSSVNSQISEIASAATADAATDDSASE